MVLLGRGPLVAAATTALAVVVIRRGGAPAVYVSDDASASLTPLSARAFLLPGSPVIPVPVPPGRTPSLPRIGCATTIPIPQFCWSPIPGSCRATAVFRRQGLIVKPIHADPELNPTERNHLALRETAVTLLYEFQGRF